MKNFKKGLLCIFAMLMALSLCACDPEAFFAPASSSQSSENHVAGTDLSQSTPFDSDNDAVLSGGEKTEEIVPEEHFTGENAPNEESTASPNDQTPEQNAPVENSTANNQPGGDNHPDKEEPSENTPNVPEIGFYVMFEYVESTVVRQDTVWITEGMSLYQFVNNFVASNLGFDYNASLAVGVWFVDATMADESTWISSECTVRFELTNTDIDAECTHHWSGGCCTECGTVCDHSAFEGNLCLICGEALGAYIINVEIYVC